MTDPEQPPLKETDLSRSQRTSNNDKRNEVGFRIHEIVTPQEVAIQ